jgi:hypothetical protein
MSYVQETIVRQARAIGNAEGSLPFIARYIRDALNLVPNDDSRQAWLVRHRLELALTSAESCLDEMNVALGRTSANGKVHA